MPGSIDAHGCCLPDVAREWMPPIPGSPATAPP